MDQITSTVLELCLISMPFVFALKMCTLSKTKSNVGIGDISQNMSINQYRSGVVVSHPRLLPYRGKSYQMSFEIQITPLLYSLTYDL